MVKRFTVCLALSLAASLCRANDVPAYRVGDVATNEVFTTTRLLVVDSEATAQIREREADKIDLFVVYSTNHAAVIRSNVSQAIDRMRTEFLETLRSNFGTDRLTREVIESLAFADLVDGFLTISPGPPVPRDTLFLWAAGGSGAEFLEDWCAPLEDILSGPIRANSLPEGVRLGGNRKVNLTTVDDLQRFVREATALSNSVRFSATNLVPLNRARTELRAACRNLGPAEAAFVVTQLEPNCRVDTKLTQRVKDFAVSGLVRMRQYEPGEVVVRQGQTIDAQALAALTEMREHAKVVALEKQVAVKEVSVQLLGERNLWLGGLLASSLGVLLLVLIRHQRKRRRELQPVLGMSTIYQGAESDDLGGATIVEAFLDDDKWRRRALDAERQATHARDFARSELMPQIVQQLKDNVVQQMASQMDDLIEVQAAVAEQMSALEARLNRIHAPLKERLHIYEKRISELESELMHRGEQNQMLLRARIEALQKQMELEKMMADSDQLEGRPS